MKLKRAIQLDPSNGITQKMVDLHNQVQVEALLLTAAKRDLMDSIISRNKFIKQVLLKKYGHVLSELDRAVFLDQTNELRIYNMDSPQELYEGHSE